MYYISFRCTYHIKEKNTLAQCPVAGCTYKTPDVDAAVIAQLLNLHKVAHPAPAPVSAAVPVVASWEANESFSEEIWNSWHTCWIMFKCSDQSLDVVLHGHPAPIKNDRIQSFLI